MTVLPCGDEVLVTGASSGIGEAIVRQLRRLGTTVHAVARSEAKLHTLAAETGCIAHVADVRDHSTMTALLVAIDPDVLVCNAGSNFGGSIGAASEEDVENLVDLNLSSTMQIVRSALQGMKRRDRGHLVFIGSIAGHHALTGGNAVYHATKAGIAAFANQLRIDLCGHRIRVTEIAPGRTRTGIFAKSAGDPILAQQQFLDGYEVLEPDDVAGIVCYALMAPAHVNIGHVEITPTLQVIGGLTTVRNDQTKFKR
ncbi:SDR family oxidoreductase [Microvirga pudoricolor]|uniref:SDR family oxidoreductase n=1 Tax=Microvirga pudoricolor TaxID=2778729 RepID=UPI00194E1711|nr:SDR family oxidoreductase [Microvirga pudoricolor]MBM6596700.1 SDR family oxidoreductase [Microvirga pudoricolor]